MEQLAITGLSEILGLAGGSAGITGVGAWLIARWWHHRADASKMLSTDQQAMIERLVARVDVLELRERELTSKVEDLTRQLGVAEGQQVADASTIEDLRRELGEAKGQLEKAIALARRYRDERDRYRDAAYKHANLSLRETPLTGELALLDADTSLHGQRIGLEEITSDGEEP